MASKSKSLSVILALIILSGFAAALPISALGKGKPAEDWGAKQLCSTLGGKEKHFRLDIDPYTFEGQKGEKVIITLSADPSGSHAGDRATLILSSRFKCFFKIDRSPLPNKVSTVLPAAGEYFVYVIEQFENKHLRSFRGSYCLTLESSRGAWRSFRPFEPPYWHKHPITWIPQAIEETISKGTSKDLDVAFISRIDLKKVNLWVTPELRPFVRIEPDHFKKIEDNIPNQVVLHLTVPADAKPGHYDGTIHLRVRHRTYPETLKVDLTVIENAPPIANAGPDQVIALPQGQITVDVQLDGSGSHDPDGSIASYTWTGTPDPEDVFSPMVTLKQGIYDFALQVTDDKGASALDHTKVTVLGPPLLMPLPEVTGEQTVTLKGISLPGATILLTNRTIGETKEIVNENGLFEVPFDLTAGLNEFEVIAKFGDVQSHPVTLKITYATTRTLYLDSISPQEGQTGSIITLIGSGFTPDPTVMGVHFIGSEMEGTGSRLEGKGVVLEATETSLRVVVPFIFLKSDEDVEVYAYDNQSISNSLTFHVVPAHDPTPDIKGNEVSYQLDLALDGLYGILTKIERFAKPRMPSEQWSIVEENIRRMIDAIEVLKDKLNAIPDDNNLKSNLDSVFSSDIFLLINEKLQEINEILSHSTEGESYCNLAKVIRILNGIIEPLRTINRILDTAIDLTYAALALDSIACFFGCVPCCVSIPILAEVVSSLSAIDGVVNAVLGIFTNVIDFLEGVIPTDAQNWKIVFHGPFKGINPHILYTNTFNKLTVYADFVSKPIETLLGDLIHVRIDIDPFGMCSLIAAIANVNPCDLLGDLLGEGIVSFVMDILPIDEVFRVTATDLPVKSTVRSVNNHNIISLMEGYETFEHSIFTRDNAGQVDLNIEAICGDYHYPGPNDPPYFTVDVIDAPILTGPLSWEPDTYKFNDVTDTCYAPKDSCTEEETYYCTGWDYIMLLDFLCEVEKDYYGNRSNNNSDRRSNVDCISYLACFDGSDYKCTKEESQQLLDNLCSTVGIPESHHDEYENCSDLIKVLNIEVEKCLQYGHWVIGGQGFGVPWSPYCYPSIVNSCYYQGRYLCDLDEYRSYLRRLCQDRPPYDSTCAHVEACYDPGERIHLCTQEEYEQMLETLCGVECNIVSEEVDICDPGGNLFQVYWNGEPFNIGSPSFDSFYIYSSPYIGFMKPGRLSVSIGSGDNIRESSIFVPPSPNLSAQLSIINQSLYPGDTLYIKGNYFTPYEEDMELLFTVGSNPLTSTHPSEVLVESYYSPEDLMLFRMPPLIDNGGETIDITVKAGPLLPCQSNNCSSGELTILPYESAGLTGADDQDMIIFGGANSYIRSAAIGDLNGDGINDLVVGIPEYRNFGYAIGAVYIAFGPVEGMDQIFGERTIKAIDLASVNPSWDVVIIGDSRDIAEGINSRRIGNSLAVGDINGDGFDDLLIGTTDQDEFGEHRPNIDLVNSTPSHIPGKAYILFGRSHWNPQYNLTFDEYDMKFYGDDERELGYQVAIGKFDKNSPYKDAVIAAPTKPVSTDYPYDLVSRVYIIQGGAGWPYALPKKDFYLPDDLWTIFYPYYNHAVIEGNDEMTHYKFDIINFETGEYVQYKGEGLGNSLAVGDINGDGYDDLVLGAPHYGYIYSLNPASLAQGAVYVIYGCPWHLRGQQYLQYYIVDAVRGGDQDIAFIGPKISNYDERTGFGSSVHVVDLNSDGRGEIVIGAPKSPLSFDFYKYPVYPVSEIGQVYIIDGGNPSLYESAFPFTPRLDANSTADLIIKGSQSISRFGYSLSAGDINNDGFKDLLVGAPGRGDKPGHVWVFYGGSSPLWTDTEGKDLIHLENRKWRYGDILNIINSLQQSGDLLPEGVDYLFIGPEPKPVTHPGFGTFVTAGDLNPYVGDDVLIIDPIADAPSDPFSGMLYVFYEGLRELQPLTIHPEIVNMNYCNSEQLFTISGGLQPYQFKWGSCWQTYIGEPPFQIPGEVLCGEDLPLPDNFYVAYGENTVLLRINGCVPNDLKDLSLKVTDSSLPGVSVTREINFLKPEPDISVSPTSIDFGDIVGNYKFRRRTIEVRNAGQVDLQINSIDLTGSTYFSQTNDCSNILPASDYCTVTIEFRPTSAGLHNGTLTIRSNDPDEEVTYVGISANVIGGPDIQVMPTYLEFPEVPLGSPLSKNVTITNIGISELHISEISITGTGHENIEFSQTNNCSGVLSPGASCVIMVTFTPPNTYMAWWATLSIYSDDSDEPQVDITLSGYGIPSALSLSPQVLDMGDWMTSSPLYITNESSACVPSLNWEIAGGLPSWLSVLPTSGTVTSCGGAYAVTVQVDRGRLPVGVYRHTILVNSNSGSGSVEVRMSVAPFLSVTPVTINFEEARKRLPLTIRNTSNSNTSLTWNIAADLPAWLTVSQMSGVIPAGGSATVYLYANRTGLNMDHSYTHTLSLTSNGGDLTIPVSLSVPIPLATFAKYYGGDGGEYFSKIRSTSDGGFIAVGLTNSFGAGPLYDVEDAWVVKLDSSGYIEWERTYGGYWYVERAYDVRETSDGGYIVVAGTSSFTSDRQYGLWILKLDSYGDIDWEKEYGGWMDDNWGDWGMEFSIQQTGDNGYIVAGHTYNTPSDHRQDVWVLKLDSSGNIQWQKTYGGNHDDYANSIQLSLDGGYIIAGVTRSFNAEQKPDMWVLKLSPSGNIEWQKAYGGTGWDLAYDIQQTNDGNYILIGYSESFGSATILKLNPLGNIQWQKSYGGWDGYGYSIKQTQDGGYILAGSFYRSDRGDDIWVVKIDPSGNIEWQKTYGGDRVDVAYSIEQTSEGDYILAGYTNSFRGTQSSPNYDAFVLKIDSVGNIGESCGMVEWTNIVPEDANIVPVDTFITDIDSSTTTRDTHATVIDSSAVTGTPCSETEEQAEQKPLIDIDVFPMSFDFTYWYGDVIIGQSVSQVFTVRNTGYQPLTISNISLSGSQDFTGSHNCPVESEVLTVARQCEIIVFFTPSIEGIQEALLSITSNDPDEGLIKIPITASGSSGGCPPEECPGGETPPRGVIPIGGG